MKIKLTKKYLIDARINRGLFKHEIAKETGWKTPTVKKYLMEFNIKYPEKIKSERYSKMWKGRTWSPETCFKNGHPQSNTGKTHFKKGLVPWNFKNAIAYYSNEFLEKRKRIRERDNNICQKCGYDKKLHVHHLDWNKNNNDDSNLITLCCYCHNYVHRKIFINNKLDWRTGYAAIVT